jgi:zinc transport system substrate-binding protein
VSRLSSLPAAVVLAIALVGCAGPARDGDEDRLQVVVGFYPLAEAAERIGGDLVTVQNLTPPGVEPHDLELAPNDVEAIVTADVLVLVGGGFQPALEDAAADAPGVVVDVLNAVPTIPPAPGDAEDEGLGVDPHVWLDPARYAEVASAIADSLTEASSAGAATFRERLAGFVDGLEGLDSEYAERLADCRTRTIVVNHAAFGYLADAYDLDQYAISGISPEAEPDPARFAELRDLVRDRGATTVFTEELTSPDVAETLAREAGVGTAVLNPLEGLTAEEEAAGEDYGSIMRSNLQTLVDALGCS